MGIQVKREPESLTLIGSERCCFCRQRTPHWTVKNGVDVTGDDVACCLHCAAYAEARDIPSKADWLRRERIACGYI